MSYLLLYLHYIKYSSHCHILSILCYLSIDESITKSKASCLTVMEEDSNANSDNATVGRGAQDLQLTSWYSAREERWCISNHASGSKRAPGAAGTVTTQSQSNPASSWTVSGGDNEMHGRDSFTRAIYLAKLKRGVNREDLTNYHEQIMNSLKSFNEAKVTGILLVYNDVVLHLLEAPADILSSLFTYLNDKNGTNTSSSSSNNKSTEENKYKNTEQMYEEVKILISSEDCPERHMSFWTQLVVSKDVEKDVTLDHENFNDDIFDIYNRVIDVGQSVVNAVNNSFQANPSISMNTFSQDAIDEIISDSNQVKRMVSMLPSNERLMAYIASANVISLVEYLSIYNDPISLSLDEDKTWPPQPITASIMSSNE